MHHIVYLHSLASSSLNIEPCNLTIIVITILWWQFGCIIGGVIGAALWNLLSIAEFIDMLLEFIPIPVFLSRLVLAIGTSWQNKYIRIVLLDTDI